MKSLKSLKCYNFGRLCDGDLIEISNSLPWLEELDISYPTVEETGESEGHITDAGIEAMSKKLRELRKIDVSAHLPLKKLALSHCQNFTLLGISSILHAHQFLSELDLRGAYFLTDQCMKDLSGYLSNVTSINLAACSKLTNSTFFILTKSCSSLTEIKMERTNLGEEDHVVDLVKNTRIRSLKLAGNERMSDDSLSKFASVCPNLQLLDVSFCAGITGGGIAEILKSCDDVRHLEVNFCAGVKSFGADSKLSKLGVLKAAGSGICDEGLVMVGQTCPWLLHLDLRGCSGVSTKGVKEIVRSCKGLREINIKGCLDLNAKFVARMVFSRPSLRKIILPIGFFPGYNQRDFLLRHGCLVCCS